jgi:hypothetical protein
MATPTERINIAVNLSGLDQNASSSVSAVTKQTTVGTSVIQGPKGDTGATGPTGATGATGAGVPVGGTTGQVLAKNSGTTNDTVWKSLAKSDVGLGNVDNTSDATKNSAVAVVTNKDLTSATNTFPTFNQNTTGSAATLTTSRTIGTLTGDVTSAGSSFNGSANNTNVTTLATVNSNVGSFGTATQVPTVTVNAKGLVTAASNTSIQIAESQVTNLTSDLASKQGTLTLTTTGTSGAATLIGSTLNIPQYAGGSGSGITRNISTITTSVTIGATAATDYVVFVGSGGAPTLPTAVSNTNRYTIKNVHTTNKTISTTSSQTIDGSTTATLTPNTSLDIISDGSNWRAV